MTAAELIGQLTDLPTVSPSAMKLVALLEHSDADNEEILEVLKYDSVLTARVLRACNSASLGFVEPVGSVEQAVLLLGYQPLLQMVLALAFAKVLSVPMPAYAVEAKELYAHSLIVGMASEFLSLGQVNPDSDSQLAFTAGLLHDLGKMALSQVLDAGRQTAIREYIARHGATRIEAEREITGTDHAEVGACLLRTWRLPEPIVSAVAQHHEPLFEPPGDLSAIVSLANCCAHLAGSAPGWEAYALKIQGQAASAFHLTTEKLDNLLIRIRESYERVDLLMSH